MAEQDDVLHLIDDSEAAPEDSSVRKWKIAVIDDDAAVHEGTRFALSDYNLHGATLEIVSAYSAAEGRTLMRDNPDIAAVLLDVIMETDVAGLELVEYIRSELKNETVRIVDNRAHLNHMRQAGWPVNSNIRCFNLEMP